MAEVEYTFEYDIKQVEEQLGRYAKQSTERLGQAMYLMAENTMTYAKENTVPVKTGYLRSTGWVDPQPRYTATSIEVRLGFGAEYADEQEKLGREVGSNPERPEAGRRYMRRAMLATMVDAEKRLARVFDNLG
jgi:hypothetical protein